MRRRLTEEEKILSQQRRKEKVKEYSKKHNPINNQKRRDYINSLSDEEREKYWKDFYLKYGHNYYKYLEGLEGEKKQEFLRKNNLRVKRFVMKKREGKITLKEE